MTGSTQPRPALTPRDELMVELIAARLKDQLAPIQSSVTGIEKDMALMKQSADQTAKTVQDHQETLHGNGKEGMITTVSHLKKFMEDTNKFSWMVIGAIVAAFIGIFIFLAQTHPMP